MPDSAKRRLGVLLATALVAVPLTSVAISYACTALATITPSTTQATAGSELVVSGSGFAAHDPSDARTEPVKLRFDSQAGTVVAEASPSAGAGGGRFTVTIRLPALDPGGHVLIATQNGTDGRPAYGTPARAGIEILAPAAAALPAAPAAPPAAPAIQLPALSQLLPSDSMTLSKAIARCKQRHKLGSAKTKAGRKRVARRRAACIALAKKRFD